MFAVRHQMHGAQRLVAESKTLGGILSSAKRSSDSNPQPGPITFLDITKPIHVPLRSGSPHRVMDSEPLWEFLFTDK
jgi:hypothetical protein